MYYVRLPNYQDCSDLIMRNQFYLEEYEDGLYVVNWGVKIGVTYSGNTLQTLLFYKIKIEVTFWECTSDLKLLFYKIKI